MGYHHCLQCPELLGVDDIPILGWAIRCISGYLGKSLLFTEHFCKVHLYVSCWIVANRVKCGMAFGNIASSQLFTVNNTGKKLNRMLYGSVCLLYVYVLCWLHLCYISMKIVPLMRFSAFYETLTMISEKSQNVNSTIRCQKKTIILFVFLSVVL